MLPHEVENGEIRTRFLRVANGIERRQVADPLDDRFADVGERRRAELFRQLLDGNPGDLATGAREIRHFWLALRRM